MTILTQASLSGRISFAGAVALLLVCWLSCSGCDTFEVYACKTKNRNTDFTVCTETTFDLCQSDTQYRRDFVSGDLCSDIGFSCPGPVEGTYLADSECEDG